MPNKVAKDEKAVVVIIKPGSAAEKSLKFVLPKEEYDPKVTSIEAVVNYGLNLSGSKVSRDQIRIQDRLRTEMQEGKHGYNCNREAVDGKDLLVKRLQEKTIPVRGTKYLECTIIVASRQEGAAGLENYTL